MYCKFRASHFAVHCSSYTCTGQSWAAPNLKLNSSSESSSSLGRVGGWLRLGGSGSRSENLKHSSEASRRGARPGRQVRHSLRNLKTCRSNLNLKIKKGCTIETANFKKTMTRIMMSRSICDNIPKDCLVRVANAAQAPNATHTPARTQYKAVPFRWSGTLLSRKIDWWINRSIARLCLSLIHFKTLWFR